MILYKVAANMEASTIPVDPNSTHFGDGQDKHPILHGVMAIGGLGAAGKSYYNAHKFKNDIDDYKKMKNTYHSVSYGLENWKKHGNITNNLQSYMNLHGITDPDKVKPHLKETTAPLRRVMRAKWGGRLGLLTSAYGTYHLAKDMSYHQV